MSARQEVVGELRDGFLKLSTENSDRMVYTRQFAPGRLLDANEGVVLPDYQARWVGRLSAAGAPLSAATLKRLQLLFPSLFKLQAALGAVEASPSSRFRSRMEELSAERQKAEIETMLNLLKSDIGYVFLDRTRLRPNGFAIGELVHTLSLTPGEETILEQKAFSKKLTSFEEQTDLEKQVDLELSSTLSTEIQEGLEGQASTTKSWGHNVGVNAGFSAEGFNAGASYGYSNNSSEASTVTATHSVRESAATSSKLASRYRAQHKIAFKISSEAGFESGAKRVIRNPNKFTAVDLHFFKILRNIEVSQERYGARLCWAPWIKEPGLPLWSRIKEGREAIIKRHTDGVVLPPKPELVTTASKQPLDRSGFVKPADDDWNLPGCDLRKDYTIAIPIENDYIWDGDRSFVARSLKVESDRNPSVAILGIASHSGKVFVTVRIEVDWKYPWDEPVMSWGSVKVTASAHQIPDPARQSAQFQRDYNAWQARVKEWEEKNLPLLDEAAAKGRAEADAWEKAQWEATNPTLELIRRFIEKNFPPASRDEYWEVDLWEKLFDWDAARFILYPGWWSELPQRDPGRAPDDFINASWARLYLPLKIGAERQALRWIVGQKVEEPLDGNREAAIERTVKDLEDYRALSFGDAKEAARSADGTLAPKHLVLAKWNEILPTDGTHIEITQSATTAADDTTRNQAGDENRLREATIDARRRDVDIKDKLLDKIAQPSAVEMRVHVDGAFNGHK